MKRLLPAFKSHSLTVWSIPQESKKSPVSWKSTFQTGYPCSANVWAQLALTKSHILTVPSPEQVASRSPWGLKARPPIQSWCPSPLIINSPLGTDHIFQVVSSLPVATMAFLGLYARDVTPIRCPLNVFYRDILEFTGSNYSPIYGFWRSFYGTWVSGCCAVPSSLVDDLAPASFGFPLFLETASNFLDNWSLSFISYSSLSTIYLRFDSRLSSLANNLSFSSFINIFSLTAVS